MATDWLFPEWKIWNQFLDHGTSGLQKDALKKSHPIEVEIPHARSVLEVFDEISYNKGSAVIKMLQHYLGDGTFQKSLSSYVQKYSWKNAKTEDLWNVLTEESGVRVDEMMTSWTKQKGYPVISVKLNGRHLEFEQKQFQSSGSHGEGQWLVPITLCVGSYERLKKFLLDTKSGGIDISDLLSSIEENFGLLKGKDQDKLDEKTWIKVNVDQSGFYRVKYEDKLAARLGVAIRTDSLSAADKYGILDDTYALCEACDHSLSSFLNLMDGYRKEIDYIVLAKLIDVCYSITEICYDAVPDSIHNLKQFFINLLQFSAERLGWESVPGESHLTVLSRGQVLTALAKLGDEKTHKEAIRRFESLVKDPNTTLLSADTKRAAYIAVMRNTTISNRNHFESLLRIYRKADTVQEKEQILRLIAGSPDPKIVLEVLNFLVSDEVRVSDIVYGLAGLSIEGRDTAWEWLKENWDFIVKKYGTGVLFPNFIKSIVMAFSSDQKADEAEEFFATRVTIEFSMNLEQSIERVRVKASWVRQIKQEKSLEDLMKHLAVNGKDEASSSI